jgi:hypothetical protein
MSEATSLFDRYVERVATDAVREYLASASFKEQLKRHIGWVVAGFEPGYSLAEREAFTKTVAARIRDKARFPVYFLGRRIWRKRGTKEWAYDTADGIVEAFLHMEKIKFGHPAYDWTDGQDLADDDMEYWESCP